MTDSTEFKLADMTEGWGDTQPTQTFALSDMKHGWHSAEPEPQEPELEKKYNILGGVKDVGKMMYDLPVNTVGSVAALLEDENPEAEYDWKDKAIEKQEARNLARSSAQGGDEYVLPFIQRQDIRDAGQSAGFSAVAMGAGVAGGLAATPIPVPGARVAGALGASGAAAYNMDKTMFTKQLINTYRQSVLDEEGRQTSPREIDSLIANSKDLIEKHALWEAIPEAAGNVAQLSGIGALFKAAMGKKIGSRVFTALAGMYGGELATETITQTGQHNVEIDAGMTEGDKRSFVSPGDMYESFKEVAPQTVVLTSLGAGGGAIAGKVAGARKAKDPQTELTDTTRKITNLENLQKIKPLTPKQENLLAGYKARQAELNQTETADREKRFEQDPLDHENNSALIDGYIEEFSDRKTRMGKITDSIQDQRQGLDWASEINQQREEKFKKENPQVAQIEGVINEYKTSTDYETREAAQRQIESLFSPGTPFNEGLAELEANIAEFRRVRSQEASVDALDERQRRIADPTIVPQEGSAEQKAQQALSGFEQRQDRQRPGEPVLIDPQQEQEIEQSAEPEEKKPYDPFARITERLGGKVEPERPLVNVVTGMKKRDPDSSLNKDVYEAQRTQDEEVYWENVKAEIEQQRQTKLTKEKEAYARRRFFEAEEQRIEGGQVPQKTHTAPTDIGLSLQEKLKRKHYFEQIARELGDIIDEPARDSQAVEKETPRGLPGTVSPMPQGVVIDGNMQGQQADTGTQKDRLEIQPMSEEPEQAHRNAMADESDTFEDFLYNVQADAFEKELAKAQADIKGYKPQPPIQPDVKALREEWESRKAPTQTKSPKHDTAYEQSNTNIDKPEYSQTTESKNESTALAPNQKVTWKTKSGKEISGTLVKKNKKFWSVKKADGKKTNVHEKDLTADAPQVQTDGAPDTPISGDEAGTNTYIGGNSDGNEVIVDKNGVRGVREGDFVSMAPVSIVPTRQGVGMSHDDLKRLYHQGRFQYLTAEEKNRFDKENREEHLQAAGQTKDKKEPSQTTLSQWVTRKLKAKEQITSKELFKQADEAYGGTQGQGAYSVKDAYDAMELGINKFIESKNIALNVSIEQARKNVAFLNKITKILATQTKRTKEQNEYQQFSTPPAFAYIANWIGKVAKEDTVLEPSAGIGGLAVFAKNAGATVFVNEFSERRADFIREMGFDEVFTEDAAQLDNILPDRIKPTVIIMNPPFSATAGRTKNNKTMNGAKHIEQALSRLEPGGRLVAIVGQGMSMDSPSFTKWWDKIKSAYNVRANIGVSGKEYAKYGTSFDNQLVVIDKAGETGNIITGKVESFSDLIPALKNLWKENRYDIVERTENGQQHQPDTSTEQGGGKSPDQIKGTDSDGLATQPSTDGMGDSEQGGIQHGNTGNNNIRANEDAAKERNESVAAVETKEPADESERTGSHDDSRTGSVDTGREPGLSGRSKASTQNDVKRKKITDAVYDTYIPNAKVTGSKTHITPLVESSAMADTKSPDTDHTPNIPKPAIKKGNLTDAQLEAIVYAGRAHSKWISSGVRKGFFIGDGTGVGKGREIAGIIWDNWRNGNKKAIWLSEKASLLNDAKRDLKGIGWTEGADSVFGISSTKLGKQIKQKEGILFTQYATLRGRFNDIRLDEESTLDDLGVRLNQIVKWAGKGFDGVIAFDEAHNMGNVIPLKGKRGTKKPSNQALAGVLLQEMLPKAKIVYVSATGATEVSNLAYATRLGLWGDGTPFNSALDFVSKISGSGISAMELVARDMKSLGLYIARSLSYADVKYDRLEHKLSGPQTKIYDTMAKGWQTVFENIDAAIEDTGGGKNQRAVALSQFWGAHQRFFNQVITAMQMPTALKQMEKDIDSGKAVVIQLVNTMAQQQEKKIASLGEGADIEDLDMTPRESLMQFLERSFPTQQYETYTDENGNERTRPVVDSNGKPVQNRAAVEKKKRLLQEMGSLSVPQTALDMIIHKFGPDMVAEVTGRKRRIILDKDGNKTIEKWSDAKAQKDIRDFMDDKKQVLIFSEKGGTGSSYHAALDAKNQRLRRHYLVQPGWRADKAVQGLGRSHRSFQKQAPEFVLITTDLPGQKRFLSSIARRLDQLGALTKGQRQTGSQGIFAAKDNLESSHAKDALTIFFDKLTSNAYDNLDVTDFERQTGISFFDKEGNPKEVPEMTQFLNRILSMTKDMQKKVFDAFSGELDQVIQRHSDLGTLDVGLETITAQSIKKVKEDVAYEDKKENVEAKYVQFELKHPARHIDFDQALAREESGFYINKKSGKIRVAGPGGQKTNSDTGDIEDYTVFINPKRNIVRVTKEDIKTKWKKISQKQARKIWNDEYSKLPDHTVEKLHLLTGTLLPLWDRLKGRMAVARLQTDDGDRYLGRKVDSEAINDVLENLGMGKEKIEMDGEAVADNVLASGTVKLSNETQFKRSKVAGENRIEYVSTKEWGNLDARQMEGYGLFSEIIQWKTRWFVPSGDSAGTVIDKVLKGKDIVSAQMASRKTDISDTQYSTTEDLTTPLSIKQIKKKWDKKASTLFLSENKKTVSVDSIIIPKDQRKDGVGSGIMSDVVKYADSVNKRVELTPGTKDDRHGTTSRARLIKFYKRFGFVENKGRNKNFEIGAGKMYREPGVKYSTDQTPGQGVKLSDIQSRFKNQHVFISPDGSISIHMKNGKGLKIESVGISDTDTQIAVKTGRMSSKGVILGKYVNSTITLNKDIASNFTRDHELMHFLKDVGMLTGADLRVLNTQYTALKRKGKLRFKPNESMEENQANTFAQLLETREQYRGTRMGSILQKIADFVDGLLHIGRMSSRKLAKSVESGKIFGRETAAKSKGDTQYQTKLNTDTSTLKKWFGRSKVVDENGEPLVVYHGTPFGNFAERADQINAYREKTKASNKKAWDKYIRDSKIIDAWFLEESRKYGNTLYSPDYNSLVALQNETRDTYDSKTKQVPLGEKSGDVFRYVGANDHGYLGQGFYFTGDPKYAEKWAKFAPRAKTPGEPRQPYVYKTFLSIQNPYYPDKTKLPDGFHKREEEIYKSFGTPYKSDVDRILSNRAAARSLALQEFGYDGIIGESSAKDGIEYVAFNPTQIKSIYNSGTWDASNPDIRYQTSEDVLTNQDYIDNRKQHKDIKAKAATSLNRLVSDIAKGMDRYLGSVSTRLKSVNPKLAAKIRTLDFDTNTKAADDLKIALPLLRKAKKMDKDDFADWDYARKNSDRAKLTYLNEKYGMEKEYKAVRQMLDRIREEAIDVGYDVGEIEEYWPRVLKDQEGFLKAIDRGPERPEFTDALKKKAKDMGIEVSEMDPTLKADIISNVILGKYYGIPGPGSVKQRVFKKIPVEFNKFYMDSDAALTNHIHSMRKRIEARRFFGKVPNKIATAKRRLRTAEAALRKLDASQPEKISDVKDRIYRYREIIEKYKHQHDFTENIGAYIVELLSRKEITPSDERTVKDILTARFNEHGTRGVIQAYKNLSYIDTMGSITSAITQIGDLAWAAYEGGMIPALKHAYKSAIGKSRITKEDVGVERIAQEFADSDTLSKAVSNVFKLVGLEKMDSIGKESLLNTAFEKYKKEAAANPVELKNKIRPIFQGETDSVVQDLLNDDVTQNVKLLVYHRLLDFQPVALSEMPEKYLTAGNGRIFYMLKTFTLKQFDVYRKEVYTGLRHGDKKQKIQAMKNLVSLTALFVLANAGADELKDWILRRDTDFEDRVVDNMLRLFGVSKFVTWKARTEGAGSAVVRQILPPFKFIDGVTKDIITAGDDKGLYATASVPIVGKLAYWHMGRGKSNKGDKWDRRFLKEKRRLNKIKDRLERSKNKPKFRVEHREDFIKLNRTKNIQGRLNKYRKRINQLKGMPETKVRTNLIDKLEDQRTSLIEKYFE